jgi:hypothetical protein
MKVVSYYTNDKYERAADGLRQSLDKFGIPYEVDAVSDQGSPLKNKQFKASFILWKLESNPTEDILVWMDADTVLRRNPLAFRYPKADVLMFSPGHDSRWSTVAVFKNGLAAKEIVKKWADGHKQHPEVSDANIPQDSRIGSLSASYVWYDPVFSKLYPQEQATVEHFCLSRTN